MIKRVNRGRNHSYIDTDTGDKIRNVTGILNDGLPKPALINWAANITAEIAVDHWDQLTELTPSQRLNTLKKARFEDRDTAANRGQEVHRYAEQLSKGHEIDVPDDLAGHIESCVAFLDDFNIQPVLTEAVVVNYIHRYAGTLDLIADLNDNQRWLIDYKTNRSGPYGDVAFQLAAYRHAEYYRVGDLDEQPMLPVDQVGIAWIRHDGYTLYPIRADAFVWRQFLYIAQVAQAAEQSRDYRLEPIIPARQEQTA